MKDWDLDTIYKPKDWDLDTICLFTSPVFWVLVFGYVGAKIAKAFLGGLQLNNWYFYYFGWPKRLEKASDKRQALEWFLTNTRADVGSKNPMRRKVFRACRVRAVEQLKRTPNYGYYDRFTTF